MNRVRAKFKCVEETNSVFSTGRRVKLAATYDAALAEDLSFAKATPSATLEMYVDNPAADFTVGVDYYVDFTPVPTETETGGDE